MSAPYRVRCPECGAPAPVTAAGKLAAHLCPYGPMSMYSRRRRRCPRRGDDMRAELLAAIREAVEDHTRLLRVTRERFESARAEHERGCAALETAIAKATRDADALERKIAKDARPAGGAS